MKEEACKKLQEHIFENELPYPLHGEYYLQNIVLSSVDEQSIGKRGRTHKKRLSFTMTWYLPISCRM